MDCTWMVLDEPLDDGGWVVLSGSLLVRAASENSEALQCRVLECWRALLSATAIPTTDLKFTPPSPTTAMFGPFQAWSAHPSELRIRQEGWLLTPSIDEGAAAGPRVAGGIAAARIGFGVRGSSV